METSYALTREQLDHLAPVRRCPDCPDGYVWGKNGPTDAECPTCHGTGKVRVVDMGLLVSVIDGKPATLLRTTLRWCWVEGCREWPAWEALADKRDGLYLYWPKPARLERLEDISRDISETMFYDLECSEDEACEVIMRVKKCAAVLTLDDHGAKVRVNR